MTIGKRGEDGGDRAWGWHVVLKYKWIMSGKRVQLLSEKILRTNEAWALATGESKGSVWRVCRQKLTK